MGRRKKSVGRGSNYSLAEIEALLKERQAAVADLEARRARLQAELDRVDAELAVTRGTAGPGRARKATATSGRKAGRRATRGPRGAGRSLEDFIRRVLSKTPGAMKLSDIKDAVLAEGYTTTSKTFGVIVGQRLAEMEDVSKAGRGLYRMGASKGASRRKTKKKAGRKAKAKGRRKAKKKAAKKTGGRRRKRKAASSK